MWLSDLQCISLWTSVPYNSIIRGVNHAGDQIHGKCGKVTVITHYLNCFVTDDTGLRSSIEKIGEEMWTCTVIVH